MKQRLWRRRAVRRLLTDERGTQLVELAIVLPLLVLMFASVAEFGRFFYTYTTLAKATRSTARYLTTAPADGSMDAQARNLAVYGNTEGTGAPIVKGLTPAQVQITRQGGTSVMPELVRVRIAGYAYQPIFDLGKLLGSRRLSLAVNVSPSTTMRFLLTQPS